MLPRACNDPFPGVKFDVDNGKLESVDKNCFYIHSPGPVVSIE